MKRFLAVCSVGLLVVVFTTGIVFGKPPGHQHRTSTPAPQQASGSSFATNTTGNNGGGNKTAGTKKKSGKPKPGKKSGNKKKNKKNNKHKKHHKKHKKHSGQGGGDMSADGDGGDDGSGADDGDDPEVAGERGLLITDLEDDGPAAAAGLDVDDTILSVNGVRVQSVEELRAALKNVRGPVEVVFISDDSGETEEVMVTPRNGRIGLTMDEVELE